MSTQQTQAVQARPAASAPAKAPTSIVSYLETPKWREEVMKVIPPGMVIDAMLRVARSTASDVKFARAEPASFLRALLKCARAGLYPDGREAHLMCFGTEVTAIFDVKGIITLASRAGILVNAKLVHENDEFIVEEDDGEGKTRVTHRVNYRKDRGDLQVVYARAVLPDGKVDYEVMTADEVDHVRKTYSKQADKGPWKDSFGEMAKKTVIKRHSKRWDMSPEIRQAINDDDDSILHTDKPAPISAPIFTAPQVEDVKPKARAKKAEPIEVVSVVQQEIKKAESKLAAQVRGRCEVDDIGEMELIEFVGPLGMSDPDDKVLEDLNEESLQNITDRWSDITDQIKASRS
jgi:recombination protein RecT